MTDGGQGLGDLQVRQGEMNAEPPAAQGGDSRTKTRILCATPRISPTMGWKGFAAVILLEHSNMDWLIATKITYCLSIADALPLTAEVTTMDSVRAAKIGRLGGMIGGKERAARLSAERRSEIAKKAAHIRWHQKKAAHHSAQPHSESGDLAGKWFKVSSVEDIHRLPGVYLIYRDRTLVYIGSSGNIRSRVGRHLRSSQSIVGMVRAFFPKSKVIIKYCLSKTLGAAAIEEKRLISSMKPLMNHHSGTVVDPNSAGARI